MEISNESAVKSYVNKKNVDELANVKHKSTENDENYSIMQTVDLGDITFSSFNDFLLGDCSYFEDSSANNLDGDSDGKIPISFHASNAKDLFSSSINSGEQDNRNGNDGKSDDPSNSKSNNLEQKLDGSVDGDDYDFYQVFEVVQSPVPNGRGGKDAQNESGEIVSTARKSYNSGQNKNTKKKKRKAIAGAIRKGQRYLPNFKRKVLEYASSHTFKATALRFNINCNTITEWARESKRLSPQQKSTTTMPANICHYKTEIVHAPASKTDIILLNDSFTIETELNDKVLKNIEQDLTPGEGARPDERFIHWIEGKRREGKELDREEVYRAASGFAAAAADAASADNPAWFALWLKRCDKALRNCEKSDNETEKYIMYPDKFKLEVVLYAKSFTKNSAARVFNVPRRRIFDWFKCAEETRTASKAAAAAVKKDKCRKDVYAELHEWYKKRFSDGSSPSSSEIKSKARELFAANGMGSLKFSEGWLHKFCKRLNIKLRHAEDDSLLIWILSQFDNNVSLSHQEITEKSAKLIGKRRKDFKGSKGWTLRFLKRHSNFLQQVPTIRDKLPELVHCRMSEFRSGFRRAVESRRIPTGSVGCMDEIPISFNYPEGGKATNAPLLRKTGFEKCQAIAFLCILADGRVLPPAVVLRGTGERRILSRDGNVDVLVLYQKDGVVDVDVVDAWVEDVWLRWVSPPSALVVDSFEAHSARGLRDRLDRENCLLSIIPEGCSSQLQPLDVEIAPAFRELIKAEWKELPSDEIAYSSNVGKKCRCPDQDTILLWIRNVHRRIEENPHSISNSFKVVGLVD